MACYYYVPFQGHCSFRNPTVSFSHKFNLLNTSHHLSSCFKPFFSEFEQLVFGVDVLKSSVKNTAVKIKSCVWRIEVDQVYIWAVKFHVDVVINRPFTAHPKRAPGTGELVTMGIAATKPFVEMGVISADGKELLHKLDLKLDRCPLCHELGVTERCIRYNVFLDFPVTVDINRLIHGGQLIKYESEGYARIGIMPRYGHADSIRWFKVKPNCTFHIFHCFEDGDEVVVWGFRALASVIPGPEPGSKGVEWFPEKFKPSPGKPMEDAISEDQLLFPRPYEWRLNVRTRDVKERYLTGPNQFPMEFPMINGAFTGVKNKYGYTQIPWSFFHLVISGMGRFGGLAKLYFEERKGGNQVDGSIGVEYHMFEKNTYCSGAAFVPKEGGVEEDDGWIITFVHHQDTNISQVYIIDTKNFLNEPVARITLPCRVPDGFHGAFVPIQLQNRITRMLPEI
ncbi:hypothetical protein GQ457_07G044720 [Hibiscus cannabinus]